MGISPSTAGGARGASSGAPARLWAREGIGRKLSQAELRPPCGGLPGPASGLVQGDDAGRRLVQILPAPGRDPGLVGLQALVAGEEQGLGLGESPLAQQAGAE